MCFYASKVTIKQAKAYRQKIQEILEPAEAEGARIINYVSADNVDKSRYLD